MSFLSYLKDGISLGSIYAIIALGYTMVYGIAKMLNFAHGDVIMVGAYVILTAVTRGGMSPVLAIVLSVIFCTVLGMVIEKVAYSPLRKASSNLAVLITAIGVSYLLQNLALLIFGADAKSFVTVIDVPSVSLFDGQLVIKGITIVTILTCIVIMVGLMLFVQKTKPGRAMQAVSEDRDAAQLMGVNVNATISMTFAIGSGLAAIAGLLLCQTYPTLTPYTGAMPGIKAFVAAVFGGIGSIPDIDSWRDFIMMNKDNRNDKIRKIAKKGLTLSLCAVLAGGLAAGSFEGVNKLAGWSGATTVEAASNKDETTLTYAKSEKKDADASDSKSDTGKDTGSTAKGSLDVSEIVSEALPSIVSITTKSVQEVQNYFGMYGMYGYAPQQQEQEVEGSGSGIIVGKNDDELLIATNYHVVEGADTLSVAFTDGNAVEASVKGFDEERDLAVVSVSLDDVKDDTMDAISIAKIGSSDDLKVGEQVIAIGNALGYGQSVTTGIVSAKNRRMDSDNNTVTDGSDDSSDGVNLIQTDAAINPGNSGGALLNMEGEVVGINSAKLASTEVEGMGYAIAISDVTDILQNLMNETSRDKLDDSEHGVLGIEGSSVSSEAVQMYGIPAGVFVKKVTEGGAADKAGLKANSVITEFNGKTVSSTNQLIEYLSYYEPDEEVELTVQVPHGTSYKEETVKVTLDENTDADDSDDNDKDSKKSKKDSKKSSKDADEDVDEDTDSEDSMDSDDTEESENPFIQYFENQGLFR